MDIPYQQILVPVGMGVLFGAAMVQTFKVVRRDLGMHKMPNAIHRLIASVSAALVTGTAAWAFEGWVLDAVLLGLFTGPIAPWAWGAAMGYAKKHHPVLHNAMRIEYPRDPTDDEPDDDLTWYGRRK